MDGNIPQQVLPALEPHYWHAGKVLLVCGW
jgi:hypothetical protein